MQLLSLQIQINDFLSALFLVAGFMLSAPPFSTKLISVRVKVYLSILLGIYMAFAMPSAQNTLDPQRLAYLFLTSLLFGFLIKVLFIVFDLIGEMVANGMGLSFPGQVSSLSNQSIGPIASVSQLLGLFVFIQMHGMEILLKQLFFLYQNTPELFSEHYVSQLSTLLSTAMKTGILLSASIWVALLTGNIGLLLAGRLSGGLNLMNSGFAILCALGIIFITLFFIPIVHSANQFIFDILKTFF